MGREDVARAIIEVLKEARGPLTFDEIFEGVSSRLAGSARKFEIREILSSLVRENIVVREPDYERKRMVYRLREG
ncbi:hypothetical protein [Hyperthermus butylicus]|uniref:hypothetical protein n=1 Tax=Hyperthermus butylicus TaxID=54248 RepID=UPI00064F74D7|nr:hypothetical protein [Hyperthermus butylicus]